MNIVFCTTCKGRLQHLEKTIPKNIEDNPWAKFVVLCYNDSAAEMWLRSNCHEMILSGRLIVYQYPKNVPFQMAHAKNMAHRCGIMEGADVLVNLDADNYTGQGFGQSLENHFQFHRNIFMWARMIKDGQERLPRGISGRIAVSRNAFLLAGGYDEKYTTHSPDDKDFNARLRRLGFEGVEIAPFFLRAIHHNDKMRFKDYPESAENQGGEDSVIDPCATVVNNGNVGCGMVYRSFCPELIEIKPIPTRVFGIGLHKTATTSLHHAFQMLGFSSGHWQTAHWAKAIWREMNETGKSNTLERYYCLSDLPIPLMFRKLDSAYPGSKFILTIRDEWNWLTSVRKHWNPQINKFRSAWDNDPFSNQVHKLLYGRKDFDPTTMLHRYRNHNAEVMEYFKDRPGDLLVLDMEKKAHWEKLCPFLGVRIPSEPYPSQYVSV